MRGWGEGGRGSAGLQWRLQPLCYRWCQHRCSFICWLQGGEGGKLCWVLGLFPPSPGHPVVGGQGALAPWEWMRVQV